MNHSTPIKRTTFKLIIGLSLFLSATSIHSQINEEKIEIPKVLDNLQIDSDGNLFTINKVGVKLYDTKDDIRNVLASYEGVATGVKEGIQFDFKDKEFSGTLYFGLIHFNDSKYPLPVYRSKTVKIVNGRVLVNFKYLKGNYDMTGWEESKKGTIGYRVVSSQGKFLYDGKVSFLGNGPFQVVNTIVSGPFINLLQPNSVTISFVSSEESIWFIQINNQIFKDKKATKNHEIKIEGLSPETSYSYTLKYGNLEQKYTFKTNPLPGSRKEFSFAYTSDSRGGAGGGERNFNGTNAYMVKKIMAVSAQKKVGFVQVTGDIIGGYKSSEGEMLLQYRNYTNAIEPFAHSLPIVTQMGNHEAYVKSFRDKERKYHIRVDNFPYATNSSETLFASVFTNPKNGPKSEDNNKFDPDRSKIDFPPYDENVFYYTYDNVAMINLNSNYWYTPSMRNIPINGGNIHGYVMDNQLKWLKQTLETLEKNKNIDHVFVTIHTPFFPNSAHIEDDMWYGGNNMPRPWIAGKEVDKGIIERRDEMLDLMINKSSKVVALLTGDEHNYCKTKIGPNTVIYPKDYPEKKIRLKRTIYQVNNGAAGAPYYAQRDVPWTPFTTGFTTQNAVCFFTVKGSKIKMVVVNPDTLEEIDELEF